MAYNPHLHTVTNKPIGPANAGPTDARSFFFEEGTTFKYRAYQSINEVFAYLNHSKYRVGNFPIFLNVGGVLNNGVFTGGVIAEYWFKNGTADSDLVIKGGGGGDISLEENARITADETLQNNIDGEALARSSADTTLQNNINTEATARAQGDQTLQTNINTVITNLGNEATARQAADTSLNTALTSKADLVGGKVPSAQIPSIAIVEYLGQATSQSAMLALSGQSGDWVIRSDNGKVYIVTGSDPTQLNSWTPFSYPASGILSINGQVTPIVVLGAGDVGAIAQLSGDVTTIGGGNGVATLATVNSSTGLIGDLAKTPYLTVNEKGLITHIELQYISIEQSQVNGLGSAFTNVFNNINSVVVDLANNYVPNSRTVNGHVLNTNISVTANDVLPAQLGNGGKVLGTDGTNSNWVAASAGTVTSVGLLMPGVIFNTSVANSPVTTSGVLTPSLKSQVTNTFLAGPTSGADAPPTFRTLVSADLPASLALVTPSLGVASGTSFNKVTITTPTTAATLTIVNGKTFTANNTITLSGTDGSTLNIGAGGTLGSNAFNSTVYQAALTTSASLASSLSDETGGGVAVFNDTPTILTPIIAAINGGTAANDDITIQGTTNATRTTSYVNLQPNGGFVGIGTATPNTFLNIAINSITSTQIALSNASTGTGAGAGLAFSNSSSNGSLFKTSSGYTTYKTLVAHDTGFYNAVAGNISVLNDYASGNINFAAGGSSTAQLTIGTTGNILIGTATALLQWGTTSSFPALKRSSTELQVRFGDDSNFAPLTAGNITAFGSSGNPTLIVGSSVSKYFGAGIHYGTGRAFFDSYDTAGSVYIPFDFNASIVALNATSAGKVGIGTATPTALLHVKAGTAAANTAPLKLTAGTNLTTPENGAIEFDGTNIFITIGGVRKTFTLT